MYAFLRGNMTYVQDDFIALDVNGVGFRVFTPLVSFDRPPVVGEELFLYTSVQVKEDSITIFGFPEQEQLEIFLMLISVSGIGARTAVIILNQMSVIDILTAIAGGDEKPFVAVPGIGKKTAARVILELKDKCSKKILAYNIPITKVKDISHTVSINSDPKVAEALTALGYSYAQANKFAKMAMERVRAGATFEEIVMEALRIAGS